MKVQPVPGAVKALKEMRLMGYEVILCATPLAGAYNNIDDIFHWYELCQFFSDSHFEGF